MAPQLERRFGLLQATALNMANMVGIGPFITIPILMTALGGPQAMLGWAAAIVITLPDGLIWSELGAALPGSGGSYVFLREAFGPRRLGRLLAFLFIWQFIFSGPLEVASGYIGFAQYVRYVWRGITPLQMMFVAAGVGALNIVLLYRRITSVARITVWLWVGTLITTGLVILTGALHFQPRLAFDFPPRAFSFSLGFLLGLGTAARIGVYDYLGYYDICYIGDEVRDPGRTIPRSVMLSLLAVAAIYVAMNLSVIGVVPWREFVPAKQGTISDYVVSAFMERTWGAPAAAGFTLLILWTTFGSVFALLLGYSRVFYAAGRDGTFFRVFGRVHPRKGFPHVAVLVVGVVSIGCSFFSLGMVIEALVTTRILIQFVGQIVALVLLRRTQPDLPRPYRIWAYPVPCLIALSGWLFLLFTTQPTVLLFGLGTLAAGALAFLGWSWRQGQWPFEGAAAQP